MNKHKRDHFQTSLVLEVSFRYMVLGKCMALLCYFFSLTTLDWSFLCWMTWYYPTTENLWISTNVLEKVIVDKHFLHFYITKKYKFISQKQPSRGVLTKRCSGNMQQIYRGTPITKCDFNKVAKQVLMEHFAKIVNGDLSHERINLLRNCLVTYLTKSIYTAVFFNYVPSYYWNFNENANKTWIKFP